MFKGRKKKKVEVFKFNLFLDIILNYVKRQFLILKVIIIVNKKKNLFVLGF